MVVAVPVADVVVVCAWAKRAAQRMSARCLASSNIACSRCFLSGVWESWAFFDFFFSGASGNEFDGYIGSPNIANLD